MSHGASPDTQAWPWRFGNNIDVIVSENCVVANCRLNDNPTDNFVQPNYILNDNAALPPDVVHTTFNYLHHSGIDINRSKIITNGPGSGLHSSFTGAAFVGAASPESEPMLFSPGIEIRDNWVKTLTRVKIKAAGNGLVIDNNTCMDESGKNYWIRETGERIQYNNSATFENRGIDFSGWNARVTRNNIFVQQGQIRGPNGYISIDGEAILVQECCGGTSVNNYTISENVLANQSSGYIGLYKMGNLNNVVISKNNLGRKNILCAADVNGCVDQTAAPCYKLNGVVIDSNYNVSTISADGKGGGSQCNNFVSRNILTPGTGYGIRATTNMLVTLDNVLNGKELNIIPVNGSLDDAGGEVVDPHGDTTINNCDQGVLAVTVKIICGSPDSVVFYRISPSGNQRLGLGTQIGMDFVFIIPMLATTPGTLFFQQIVGRIFSANGNSAQWTRVVSIRKECELPVEPLSVKENFRGNQIQLIPNPTDSKFFIRGISQGEVVSVSDAVGKNLISQKIISGEAIDMTSFKSGLYLIHVPGKGTRRLIKR